MPATLDRRLFLRAGAAASCGLAGWPTRAATDPPAAGRMLFGFPPGSSTARIGTALLRELQGRWTPAFGSELTYLPGNSGGRCIEALRRAAPDGATAMVLPSSPLTLMAQRRALPTVDLLQTLTPVASVAGFTFTFVVGPAVPADVRSMADYARWVKNDPAGGGFGSTGSGSAPDHIGASIARVADLPLKSVAYQGHAAQIKDLLDGALPAAVLIFGSFEEARRDGRLRALALSGGQRWPTAPALPTLRELGMSDIEVGSTLGVHLPPGSLPATVEALNATLQLALDSPAFAALLTDCQMTAAPTSAAAYAATLAREQADWAAIIKRQRFDLRG